MCAPVAATHPKSDRVKPKRFYSLILHPQRLTTVVHQPMTQKNTPSILCEKACLIYDDWRYTSRVLFSRILREKSKFW